MTQAGVVSAATFFFQTSAIPALAITELKNINTHVEAVEYIYADEKTGKTMHTKQYGKTKPPSVTFVTGVEPNAMKHFFTWHDLARTGKTNARQDATIHLMDAGENFKISYNLEAAWCSKLEVSGAKAGSSDVVTLTITLECDKIECLSS
jgi:phage tail-like protein